VSRRRALVVAVGALIVLAAAWALLQTNSSDTTTPTAGTSTRGTTSAGTTDDGTPTCPLSALPREAVDTVRVIHAGAPFPFPRNDGVVFGNREGHLPQRARGYYHEYTVITPGAKNRSTRRIITGGAPLTNPLQYLYTADHYDSFCLITDAERQR
jgi:ribonuclease T1